MGSVSNAAISCLACSNFLGQLSLRHDSFLSYHPETHTFCLTQQIDCPRRLEAHLLHDNQARRQSLHPSIQPY